MNKELFEHVEKLTEEEILKIILDLMSVDESIFHPVKDEGKETLQETKKEDPKP